MIDRLLVLALLLVVGAVTEAPGLVLLLRWRPGAWVTPNYRGRAVIGRAGISFLVPLLASGAVTLVLGDAQGRSLVHLSAVVFAAAAFGALGWLDDAHGDPVVHGLKGHLRCLVKWGRVTTGLAKLVGGALVGLSAAYLLGVRGLALVPAGAVVALSANALNVLDRRPGRAVKGFTGAAVVVLALACLAPLPAALPVLAGLVGAAAVFGWADLTERAMLGDTGANSLGAALGVSVVALTVWPAWLALSVGLLSFCLAADRWSLSAAFETTRCLRWLDQLGRPRELTTGRGDGSR